MAWQVQLHEAALSRTNTFHMCNYILCLPRTILFGHVGAALKIVVVVESCGIEPLEWDKRGLIDVEFCRWCSLKQIIIY